MKIVEYLGSEYLVPDWANFLAADSNGDVYAYGKEPYKYELDWERMSIQDEVEYVGNVERPSYPLKRV